MINQGGYSDENSEYCTKMINQGGNSYESSEYCTKMINQGGYSDKNSENCTKMINQGGYSAHLIVCWLNGYTCWLGFTKQHRRLTIGWADSIK